MAEERLLIKSNLTSSQENIDCSDLDEMGDDDVRSKRQRLSAPLSSRTVLNPYQKRSRRSLPILEGDDEGEDEDEDEDEVGPLSVSVDSKPASNARTAPAAFESPPPTEPKLAAQVIGANQDWEVRQIIGKEDVDGVLHYLVDWSATLVPEYSLGHAKELVEEFEARLLAQRRVKNGRGGTDLKRGKRGRRVRGKAERW